MSRFIKSYLILYFIKYKINNYFTNINIFYELLCGIEFLTVYIKDLIDKYSISISKMQEVLYFSKDILNFNQNNTLFPAHIII